jgi:hypothetical protein
MMKEKAFGASMEFRWRNGPCKHRQNGKNLSKNA